jgi:beta-lactamase class A
VPIATQTRGRGIRHGRRLALLGSFAMLLQGTLLCTAQAASAQRKGDDALQRQIATLAAAHHGHVALYAENLRTGVHVGLDADKPVQTASVIKLTILFAAMEQVRAGQVKLLDPVVLQKDDQVGGSGVLQLLDAPVTLTLKDVLTLMITHSDNTATNLAIDKLGLHAINAETRALGLENTWLYKKISKPATEPMPPDQKIYGLGKTTAREMATLLGRIYRCQFAGPARPDDAALCTTMLGMLQKQSYRDGLPRLLEQKDSAHADAAIGNKTGALDAVRNDVGLVATRQGPLVLAIFTYGNADTGWSSDNEGELTIARLTQLIVQTWAPDGLDPEGYRPLAACSAGQAAPWSAHC